MNKEIVFNYYKYIDAKDWEKVFDLFSDDVFYNRGGRIIKSKKNLKDFYLTERKLNGNHILEDIFENKERVLVLGKFLDEIKGEINFVDAFYVDNGKIFKRMTYLLSGSEQTV